MSAKTCGNFGLRTGAEHPLVQFAGDLQQRIAQLLAFKPFAADMPKQFVGSVGSNAPRMHRGCRIDLRRLAIRRRQHHQSLNRFDMPTIGHELRGQPIQQLRMRRVSPHRAKIVRRRHNALAEMILPQPIDNHPRRQRVIVTRQPFGQRRSAAGRIRLASGGCDRRFARTQKLWETWRHLFARASR